MKGELIDGKVPEVVGRRREPSGFFGIFVATIVSQLLVLVIRTFK